MPGCELPRNWRLCSREKPPNLIWRKPASTLSAYKNCYRPGITEMLADSRKGIFDMLYVHKVDRLARRLEWFIEIMRKLQGEGITLKAVEQNFDCS